MARLGDRDAILEVGDQGIWVTFARGMDRKAIAEFRRLCDEVRIVREEGREGRRAGICPFSGNVT